MGSGDNPELTPSDAEVVVAEESTRSLLARFGEPTPVEAPPGLASRVVAALPATRRPPRALRRQVAAWAAAAAAALLLALGTWGALGTVPAGEAGTPLGQLTLTLARAARPLLGTLVIAGLAVVCGALVLAGGLWLWRRGSRKRGGG